MHEPLVVDGVPPPEGRLTAVEVRAADPDDLTAGRPVDAARTYAARGWRVVPIAAGTKHPAHLKAWQEAATTDPELIAEWWERWPDDGVGIATGQRSGIWALDVDPRHGGDDTLADLEATHGRLPATMEVLTGSGGRHLYFAWPEGRAIRNDQAGRLGPGLDVRGDGGQVVAPPTVHPNGTRYEWELSSPLRPALAPDWLVDLLTVVPTAEPRRERAPYDGPARPGDRWAATVAWADLLEADGATFVGRRVDHRSGHAYELWCRPGKSASEGASATLYYGGSDVLKVFSPNWPGLAAEQTYTRFGYIAATRYGGDHTAAARAMQRDQDAAMLPRGTLAAVGPATGAEEAVVDVEAPDDHGWEPADVASAVHGTADRPQPTLLARADGRCLFYEGRVNGLFGMSGTAKSWVTQLACAEVITSGHHALIIDLEDHLDSVVARFRDDLGVEPAAIAERLHYISPAAPLGLPAWEGVRALIERHDVRLVVIDSTGEALALQGLDPNADDAVSAWGKMLPGRIARMGVAVVLVDHVPKSADAERLMPISSQRKLAAIDGAMFRVDTLAEFSRVEDGRFRLTVAKDRNGVWLRKQVATEVDVRHERGRLTFRFEVPPDDLDPEVTGGIRRTVLAERISDFLVAEGRAVSQRAIRERVRGKTTHVAAALQELIDAGFVERTTDPGGNQWHSLLRPFSMPVIATDRDDSVDGGVVPGWFPPSAATDSANPADSDMERAEDDCGAGGGSPVPGGSPMVPGIGEPPGSPVPLPLRGEPGGTSPGNHDTGSRDDDPDEYLPDGTRWF